MRVFPRVHVRTTDGLEVEGLLISRDDHAVTIKLDNGYNIRLLTSEVERLETREDAQVNARGADDTVKGVVGGEGKEEAEREGTSASREEGGRSEKEEKDEGEGKEGGIGGRRRGKGGAARVSRRGRRKDTVLIVNTGGTIASRVEYETGAVRPAYHARDILKAYPELEEYAMIITRDAYSILSEDARFTHYNILGRIVWEAQQDDIRGILVAHGTDTMQYTAAALRFAIPRLRVPVILVGSQRSSDRPSSDSRMNVLNAVFLLTRWPEALPANVYVLMHASATSEDGLLMEGVWARKMHSSRRDAFESLNKPWVARVNALRGEIILNPAYEPPRVMEWGEELSVYDESLRIGMVYAHPHMHADELLRLKDFDGIIILGTGFGHLGVVLEENKPLLEAVRQLAARMPVVMSRQALRGVTNLNVYTAGRLLKSAGVLGHGCDMLPEVAFIKLAWLLSVKRDPRDWFERNIIGECQSSRGLEEWER